MAYELGAAFQPRVVTEGFLMGTVLAPFSHLHLTFYLTLEIKYKQGNLPFATGLLLTASTDLACQSLMLSESFQNHCRSLLTTPKHLQTTA